MMRKGLLFVIAFGLNTAIAVSQTTIDLLPTKAQGAWDCVYYLLNNNEELEQIDIKEWAGRCADEDDWIFGYGPLSNSDDQFLVTHWASEVQPLIVRRHFILSAEDIEALAKSTVTLLCSYDENPHFYLNGISLCSFAGWNDDEYASRPLTSRQKALLREGDNVLAVSLTQGNGGGHIDYGLIMTLPTTPSSVSSPILEEQCETIYSLGGLPVFHENEHNGIYIKQKKKYIHK